MKTAQIALEGQIIDGLLKNLTADIPECMIDSEVENLIRERDYSLRSQGLDLNTYLKYMNSTLDDMRAQLRPMAERQVKTRLALEKIAEIENIKAEEADINAEYEKMSAQYSMELDKVKEALSSDALTSDIILRKTVDFVKSKAVITEKNAEDAAKESKPKSKTAKAAKTEKKDEAEGSRKNGKTEKAEKNQG